MNVLITRRRAMNEKTAVMLIERGHRPVTCALVENRDTGIEIPGADYGGLIFTSQAAVDILAAREQIAGRFDRDIPVFVVGSSTAGLVTGLGFRQVHCAGGDAASLVELIRDNVPMGQKPLLYLAGVNRSIELDQNLAKKGIEVDLVEIYTAELFDPGKNRLEAALREISDGCALLYSVRTAMHLLELCSRYDLEKWIADVTFIAISDKVGQAVASEIARPVIVAKQPCELAMLDAIVMAK